MQELYDFIDRYAERGDCRCGHCIDAPADPKQPQGHTADMVFFKVAAKTDRLTFVTFADDHSVSAYLGNVWLANENTREEAEREAIFNIRAFDNGAFWAHKQFPGLAI